MKKNDPTPSSTEAAVLGARDGVPLAPFFRPESVAVIGATETLGTVGRTLLENLIAGDRRPVYPVNLTRPQVLGRRAYARLSDLPLVPDLAVVAVPAAAVPAAIEECATLGVPAAIVISAGFRETGPSGAALEAEVLARAAGRTRLIGPNCLGVLCPPAGLNASFAGVSPRPGRIAFLSQSGALGTAILDWSLQEKTGFSAFVSVGSMLDVGWGDLIDHFGRDAGTEAILIYMESVGDARAFLSAAREAALAKPIIVLKAGRTEPAVKAAVSHTGGLGGADDVLDAAFRRCGVTRVTTIAELFQMANVLSHQPRPKGPRLAILTNAGGPAVLAVDALTETGGRLAELGQETVDTLRTFLPAAASAVNPVDILGDAGAERYERALAALAADPGADGLLAVLTPQAMTDAAATAKALAKAAKTLGKPVLASWMGAGAVRRGRALLSKAGIPVFAYPDAAARAFTLMWRHAENLRALYETPTFSAGAEKGVDLPAVAKLLGDVRREGRTLLTEDESKRLLIDYGLPALDTRFAPDEEGAVLAAAGFAGRVVLKLRSKTITHKSDIGGVRLGLRGAAEVREAFRAIRAAVEKTGGVFEGVTVQAMEEKRGIELILGAKTDPTFGPVILFGAGGRLVEIYKDYALGLPPLNTTLARRLMERTKIYRALQGTRGEAPCDMAALERLLVRFSRLMAEQAWIKEVDINPVLASGDRFVALDARVVLFDPASREEDLPGPAIRPYPFQYAGVVSLRDGSTLAVRPIRPEDEPLMADFHRALSERSVYLRYTAPLVLDRRIHHDRLVRVCFSDYDREIALVAEGLDASGRRAIVAVGRLSRFDGGRAAQVSLLVSDAWHGKGLGTQLLARVIDVAKREKIRTLRADILTENAPMQRLCGKAGFHLSPVDGVVRADMHL